MSERLSRALMAVGEGLGDMSKVKIQGERDQADQMRRESLARLRGEQQSELNKQSIEGRKEIAQIELSGRRELMEEDRALRSEEADKDRQFRRETQRENLSYQDRRIQEQSLKRVSSEGEANVSAIDNRISEIRNMVDKASLDGVGMVNEEAKQRMEMEIEGLSEQRKSVKFRNIMQLKNMGDPRYVDMDLTGMLTESGYSPERVQLIVKDAEGDSSEPEESVGEPPAAPEAPAASSVSRETPAAPQAERQLMQESSEEFNPLGSVEFGQGGRQIMDLMRRKPWIKSQYHRERLGLDPLADDLVASN